MPLPLEGLKVLDLSRVLAGPLCTTMLGDLGANVLKVERPGSGDDTRGWGPPFDPRGESAYFLSINRNKLGMVADFRDPADRAVLASLIAEADIVVENFLPGALHRVGLSIDVMLASNRRLVWCTITGFGAESDRPGYDFVVQAESGWMAITGDPAGEPMKAGVAVADLLAGRDAAIAILAALAGRDRSGASRRVVISLADSARGALVNVAQNVLVSGRDAGRWGNAHANLVPYQMFAAGDRELVIAVGSDAQWLACCEALDLAALGADPALRQNAGRVAQRERVSGEFQRVLRAKPAADWIEALRRAGVPCGLVKSVREAIADATGASPLFGMPPSVGGSWRLPPPRLDEHGALVRSHGWAAFDHLPDDAKEAGRTPPSRGR